MKATTYQPGAGVEIKVYHPQPGVKYKSSWHMYHWVARWDGAVIGEGHSHSVDSAIEKAMDRVVDTVPAPEA